MKRILKLLVVSATEMEVQGLKKLLRPARGHRQNVYTGLVEDHHVNLLITGAGLLHTAFHTSRWLATESCDVAVQLGVAGSFNPDLAVGEVVQVVSETVADWGADSPERFLPITELSFFNSNQFPYQNGYLRNIKPPDWPALNGLKQVSGISVNRGSGTAEGIAEHQQLFRPEVETMEGAAFFLRLLVEQRPVLCHSSRFQSH